MTPQCCSCHRFVNIARCNHFIEYGDYGTVHSVEYECERCAEAARPYDQPPLAATSPRNQQRTEDHDG